MALGRSLRDRHLSTVSPHGWSLLASRKTSCPSYVTHSIMKLARRPFASLILLACLTASLPAQEKLEPSASIGKGVLASWNGTRDLAEGGELPLPMPASVALSDFALSFILELDAGKTGDISIPFLSLTDPDSREVLTVQAAPSGRIIARLGQARLDAQPPQLGPVGKPHHIVISIRRDTSQALSSLWIDGVERSSVVIAPGQVQLGKAFIAEAGGRLGGKISDVRLYDRALARPEITELTRSTIGETAPLQKPFGDTLELMPHEVIAVLGGSEAANLAEDGSLEALLALQFPGLRFSLRSLAWENDTVLRQDRPQNFGDLAQQLQRVEATCVMLMFGRQECLDLGEAGLDQFREALGKIIATCQAQTPRIIILGLPPFEAPEKAKEGEKPKPDLRGENPRVQQYNAALRSLASDSHLLFAEAPKAAKSVDEPLTFDGLNIGKSGVWQLATRFIGLTGNTDPLPKRDDIKPLIAAIQGKNRLWRDFWRTTNWGASKGEQAAPSNSLDAKTRWHPAEQEKFLQLIREADQEIHQLANGALKMLP